MPILTAEQVSKSYSIANRSIRVLDRISLTVDEGKFVVVAGDSGSGKTTLLSILSGLDQPDAGRVRIGDRDITSLSEDDLAPLRNRSIGFVFQAFHLIPALTAYENIVFPAQLGRDADAHRKAADLMEKVGMTARARNYPHQLSGGEKQRVAICRALINQPQVLFADEPTGNLDATNARTILTLLQELSRENRTSLVMATHSHEIALRADRVLRLIDGRLIEESRHAA